MTQTNPGNGSNLCTSLQVHTAYRNAINCQKNDEKNPPRARRRRKRRDSLRVLAQSSVRGTTDEMSLDMAGVTSTCASPDQERKRRKSIVQNHEITNLMRFVTNNSSERITLLQIAMKPSEVCYRPGYRSHNSLSHKLVVT